MKAMKTTKTANPAEATLRFAELVPVDERTTALRTVSRRWYLIEAPIERLETSLRSGDLDAELDQRLRDEGSLVTVRRPLAAAPTVVLSGDLDLCTRLRDLDGSGILRGAFLAMPDEAPAQVAEGGVLIVARGDLDEAALREMGRRCRDTGRSWALVDIADAAGWFGPLFRPEGELSVDDLLGRRTAAARPHPWEDGRPRVRVGTWATLSDPELAWMAGAISTELDRWARGEDCLSLWHELELRPGTLTVVPHLVLPLPFDERAVPSYEGVPEDLVDEHTGVVTRVTRIQHHPSIPRELITVHAHTGAAGRISPWRTDPVAGGTSFVSEEHARQAAIGEAVERYSGNIVQESQLRVASWEELRREGEHAVDPESLVLFSPSQYAAPGFPFVPMTRDLRFHWVRGRSLTQDRRAWLPASLVYGNWYAGPYGDTAHFNNTFHPGLAAGPDIEFAVAAGIQEIIERHATMVWWHNAQPLPSARLSARLAGLWSGRATEEDQRAWLIPLENEFGVPVMAGVVEHVAERVLTIGFAARPEPEEAALKAWAEALTLQDGARDLDRQYGGYRQSAERGEINASYVKPWREDRRYLDDYRPDFRDAVDLMCQLQLCLDPRTADRVRPLVETPATVDLDTLPRLPGYSVEAYRKVVEDRGFEIFYADVTTSDVACTGLRVVRVLIPGLVPNFAAAFPYLGLGKLTQVAVDLGWRSRPLAEAEINVFPLPHA